MFLVSGITRFELKFERKLGGYLRQKLIKDL